MGLRYRKSVNLGGGFRVNLSTKGIGYSWGVKGYRITKTADGRTRQTASIPGTGISYVEEHGPKRRSAARPAPVPKNPLDDYSDIKTVKSADAMSLRSSEYEELFKSMKRAKLIRIAAVIVTILTAKIPVLFYICAAATAVLFYLSRSVIEYEFDDVERQKWDEFSAAWRSVAASQSLQEITMTAKAKNARVTAGIENAYDVAKMSASGKLPWYLKTNIKPVVFTMRDRKFAIMPDRLLVFTKKELGALDYDDVKFDLSAIGFVETGAVPSDAEVVKQVWAYANNDGTPDKRYSDNRQFPVMKYGKIIITSAGGLNIQFMCSNEDAADKLNQILNPQ